MHDISIFILMISTHGDYYDIRYDQTGMIKYDKRKAPINFNMIAAAPLGICNIVTKDNIESIVNVILHDGHQLLIQSENDEMFTSSLNQILKNNIDKNIGWDINENKQKTFVDFMHKYTSRYTPLKKIMKYELYHNKYFSFDLHEKDNKNEFDMTITLFEINETDVFVKNLSSLFSRPTRSSGTHTTLHRVLRHLKKLGIDNVILLDLTCSTLHPDMSDGDIRQIRRDYVKQSMPK
jgi:hypothetical protein